MMKKQFSNIKPSGSKKFHFVSTGSLKVFKIKHLFLFIFFIAVSNSAFSQQCQAAATFTTAFTTPSTCATNYTKSMGAGEYAGVILTANTAYTFSLTTSTAQGTGICIDNGGNLGTTTVYTPGSTTTYTVAVFRANGTWASSSAVITYSISASVGGSIAGGATVCTGTNSTGLTLSGHRGAITKWQSSTVSDFSSSVTDIANTTTSLTATNLTATTYYRAVVSNGGCTSANSSSATVTVNAASVGGSVSGGATVCTGTNSTGLTLSGHTGSVTKWQSSTVSDFSSSVTDIANTTTSLTATNLTATTYYRAVVTSGVCAAANSSSATITVNAASVGGSIAGGTSVCTGTNSTGLTLSGHTGSITKWQSSTVSDFSSSVTDIANTTTSNTATNLTATTYYRAVVTSGVCALAYSATATIVVNPNSTAPSAISQTTTTSCLTATLTVSAGGLAAYYPFTSDVNDASGNGLNLSGSGGTFSGGGIQLTTTSSYASVATSILNTDKYTISFDIKYTANSDGSWRKIFGYSAGGSDRSPGIWRYPSSMQLHWRHDPGNTGLAEAATYTLNQWYNVVGEKNGNTFTLYIDGVQVDQGTVADPKTSGEAALWFGGAEVLLKEFKIYNGILRWYTSSCGGVAAGSSPTISVSPASNTTYYVRSEGACSSSSCANVTLAPPAQATTFTYGSITTTSMTLGWTRGAGTGGVLVVAKAGSASTDPTSGASAYTANAAYGSGTALGGGFVVYKGTGTSVALTGLSVGTTYYFAAYEYNTGECYNFTELSNSSCTIPGQPSLMNSD